MNIDTLITNLLEAYDDFPGLKPKSGEIYNYPLKARGTFSSEEHPNYSGTYEDFLNLHKNNQKLAGRSLDLYAGKEHIGTYSIPGNRQTLKSNTGAAIPARRGNLSTSDTEAAKKTGLMGRLLQNLGLKEQKIIDSFLIEAVSYLKENEDFEKLFPDLGKTIQTNLLKSDINSAYYLDNNRKVKENTPEDIKYRIPAAFRRIPNDPDVEKLFVPNKDNLGAARAFNTIHQLQQQEDEIADDKLQKLSLAIREFPHLAYDNSKLKTKERFVTALHNAQMEQIPTAKNVHQKHVPTKVQQAKPKKDQFKDLEITEPKFYELNNIVNNFLEDTTTGSIAFAMPFQGIVKPVTDMQNTNSILHKKKSKKEKDRFRGIATSLALAVATT